MNFLIFLSILKKKKVKTYLNNIKLIVCDIDGTLTHDGTIYLSDYTKETIEKLHQQGIEFGLASGRSCAQLIALSKEWDLSFDFEVFIGGNGTEYYDGKRKINHTLYLLSEEDIKDIIEKMLDKYPDLNCSIYKDGARLLRYEDEMAVMSKKRNKMQNRIVSDLSEMWKDPCHKVMFRVSEEVMLEIEPYANEISNNRYRSCKTQTTMMEFVRTEADKGSALKRYCLDNNIDLEEVAAFGDQLNDKEMIEVAGLGVCMINGCDECKQVAKTISDYDNNQDGCARYIEDYILS